MADYIVKDTELTSVANAIRTAGGTNSLLNFPNGFVSAVNNISGGGGGSSDFSTAEITFVNNTGGYLDEQYFNGVPGINDVEDYYSITGWLYVPSMNSDTSVQVTIPLYKNSYWTVDEYITPSGKVISGTSGDITIDEEHSVHITGDCTITIS